MQCKNCNGEIVPDPTDPESWVHEATGDGACDPKVVDAWAEPEGTEVNHQAVHVLQKVEALNNKVDQLEDTLTKANTTITNLFRKEPLRYPELAKDAVIRTLTFEKANLQVEGGEILQAARAFKEMLMMIHQEVVNVEKVNPNDPFAKKIRDILGSPEDFIMEENKN